MSTETKEQLLTGEIVPGHLTTNPQFRLNEGLTIDVERGELGCTECQSRITRNTKSHREYGHARACSHHETFGGFE